MTQINRDSIPSGDGPATRGGDVDKAVLLHLLQSRFPELLALYAFGSRVTGGATAESDLDLAILVDGGSTRSPSSISPGSWPRSSAAKLT